MAGQELIMIPIRLSNVVLLLGGRLALDMGHSQKALTAQWVILRKHRRVTSGERRSEGDALHGKHRVHTATGIAARA